MNLDTFYEEDRDGLRIDLRNAPSIKENTVRILFTLDYFLIQQNAIKMDNVFDWIETAHNNIETVFLSTAKEKIKNIWR